MLKIFGAEGKIDDIDKFLNKINEISEQNNIIIQVFNADLIYGKKHLISAVNHAKRAFKNKTNTTNSLEMEIMIYAAGERQLKNAIPKIGIKKGKSKIAILFLNHSVQEIEYDKIIYLINELNLDINDKVLEGNINTLEKFGINRIELETVNEDKYQDLILEKVAIVDILK